jgi:Protein of unknown function (DUF3616)
MKFKIQQELQHFGICDASGAIAIDEDHFVVANDEDNILRIYRTQESGAPVAKIEIDDYFVNVPIGKEVDIEGATQIGDILYWISSHGRNKSGKPRPARQQFFANRWTGKAFEQVGASYIGLLADLIESERLQAFDLAAAAELPPKAPGGLNIEGLTATPEGEMLIGFRNPIPGDRALIVPLQNPQKLVTEKGARAKFGDPLLLDLGGLGIRSLEYWAAQQLYLIIAGAWDGSDAFALYSWAGGAAPAVRLDDFQFPEGFRPESVLFYPQSNQLQFLSDDGSIPRVDNIPCKEIEDQSHPQKYFRSLWVALM